MTDTAGLTVHLIVAVSRRPVRTPFLLLHVVTEANSAQVWQTSLYRYLTLWASGNEKKYFGIILKEKDGCAEI